MKKVLIFNPFGIGDVLFSTPLIRNLKDKFPNVSITYICNRRVYPLMKSHDLLDNVLVFEKDEWRDVAKKSKAGLLSKFFSFRNQIRRGRFDVMFDLSLNSKYGLFFKYCKIKKRIGFNYKNRGRFLTHKLDLPDGYCDKHVANHVLDLLRFIDVEACDYKFDLFLPDDAISRCEGVLEKYFLDKDQFLIAVCPGSGDSWEGTAYYKRWAKGNFIDLCQRIHDELGAKVILFGSNAETEICEIVYNAMKVKPLNLCGRVSLDEFCGIVSFCRMVITNDGGPLHIAQALGKGGVAFFGPVDEKVYGIYPPNDNYRILKNDVECRPCYKKFRFTGCDYHKQCLDIEVDRAFEAVKELLK
ncbi:MAG: glycosyltransferase family 9 protein [Candidatus Omnitrophica bacterium]|nr:glycosyltransferase family 9 protein [Candidatus Omnitrophota bacterium]